MSFGGGFGGFGQNNQQSQNTPFGFGQTSNTSTSFGSTGTSGFGGTTSNPGGIFGGTSGFGGSGGFGSTQQSSGFGAKPTPAFGSTSGAGIFGTNSTPNTGGFPSGFGSSNANSSTPFGTNTNAGLFNQPKSTFGTAGSSTFGGTSSTFGSTPSFGGSASSLSVAAECQGTGSVPFQAHVEKEQNSTSNQQNSFQSISFQAPYVKWSPEELRLADYAQGRRFGNSSGQVGAFGTSTNFGGGGFGTTNTTSGFGSGNSTGSNMFGTTSTPFGQNTQTTGGFGTNTNASPFGKPATTTSGGIFGAPTQTANSTGLFGSTGTAAFGSNTGNSVFGTSSGNSIFGGGNQNKPSFGFGTTNTGSAFGTNTGASGFGSTFGSGTQSQPTSTPFGASAQTAPSNPFSAFGTTPTTQSGSTLFGSSNNQTKSGTGLFNSTGTSAGAGIFGSTSTTAAPSPFGQTSTTANNPFAAKPAAIGTSNLFGSGNTTNTSSVFGSGFGTASNQNQQQGNTTGNLFGSLNSGQQPKPLFGSQTQQTSSLFGGNNQQNTTGFGSVNNPQVQQNSLSPFGTSSLGSQQAQPSLPQSLTASINDPAAFGTTSMFANLAAPDHSNPGPLATPLSKLSKQKKSPALPMLRMNPSSTSRFITPQKRGIQGFGFSYSTYGTPGSVASSSSTPLLTVGNSAFKGLRGSVSTSNLSQAYNSSFTPRDSLLRPGAFSVGADAKFRTGNMKTLNIDRSFKSDLFQPASKESLTSANSGTIRKKVSFDSSTVGGDSNGNVTGSGSPLKQVQSSITDNSGESGYATSPPRSNGNSSNGVTSPPEMEQVRGNELVRIEEVAALATANPTAKVISEEDQVPGDYWMKPTKEEILHMNRMQRQSVSGFTVGRDGVGEISFDEPVDLSNVNFDTFYGDLVLLNIRSATVYPDPSKKPPVGRGLNVPATIQLWNSWPRGKDKRTPTRIKKHTERLRRVTDTKFQSYDENRGIWCFKVPHFTTYGVPDDDDDSDLEEEFRFDQDVLNELSDTSTLKSRVSKVTSTDQSFNSDSETSNGGDSILEDTFDFKKILPGAFNNQEIFLERGDNEEDTPEPSQGSFLDDRSAVSQSDIVEEILGHVPGNQELVRYEDQEMTNSSQLSGAAEVGESQQDDTFLTTVETPGAIARAKERAAQAAKLSKQNFRFDSNDWSEMLRQTISPQKQDRAQLKQTQTTKHFAHDVTSDPGRRVVSDGRGFSTSIDLMHSLFGDAKSSKALKGPDKKGFEWPYARKPKTGHCDESNMTITERAFQNSIKPRWGGDGTLVFAGRSDTSISRDSHAGFDRDGLLVVQKRNFDSEAGDVRFARFSSEFSANMLKKQISMSTVTSDGGIPYARLNIPFRFADFFDDLNTQDPAAIHERLVWDLASVLFDPLDIPEDLEGIPDSGHLLRKDNLSVFWQTLVDQASSLHIAMARSSEEKAIACLSGHKVVDACSHLVNGRNFHLATLVALTGGNGNIRSSIREQLNEWQKSRVLSEFSQPIRAIYELLAGNACVCDGTKGAHVEDRMESFVISKRFGLDWRQAFGLRLWYAVDASEDFTKAVHMFAQDLEQDKEATRPQAWYVEQGISPLWDDSAREDREDLLWGLLKLHCDRATDLEAILRPENSQLSPLNVRIPWQLSCALTNAGVCSYGSDADEKADQLTLSFAAQLTSEGSWLDATFVLLHLSAPHVRAKRVQDHLAYHAGRIGREDSPAFSRLTRDYRIPASWIWEAKALYMRAIQKDPRREVECLLNAGAFNEAHKTFSREVAPNFVIEGDWEAIQNLLTGFKGRESTILEWNLGGQLYVDYLTLLESQKGTGKIDGMVLERLLAALPAIVRTGRHPSLSERIATQEMSGVVSRIMANLARHSHNRDVSRVLSLPLTEDRYLKHTVDLGFGLYKSIMAGGR